MVSGSVRSARVRFVHPQGRDVQGELLRDVAGERLDLDLVGDLLQDPAFFSARGLADHVQRHRDLDALAHVHRGEVHVDEAPRHRVALHVDDARRRAARAHVDVVERVVPEVMEGVVHHPVRDRQRRGSASSATIAVEDRRDHPRGPQAPGCVLAALGALFRLKFYVVCHLPSSPEVPC
jgi:hypothetical protein